MLIPFSILLLLAGKKLWKKKCIWYATRYAFEISLLIEIIQIIQIIFRVGTFQLSDLITNTVGGFIGGLIYFVAQKINKKNVQRKDENYNQENESMMRN